MNLSEAINGHLSGWNGLAAGITRAEFRRQLEPVRSAYEWKNRTRMTRYFDVVELERSVPPLHVEGWFLNDDAHLTLVEVHEPVIHDLAELLARFGPADMVQKHKHVAYGAVVDEHIYAQRGVTLSLVFPVDASAEQPVRSMHLQLYAAMTAQDYLMDIGAGAELRPYPRS